MEAQCSELSCYTKREEENNMRRSTNLFLVIATIFLCSLTETAAATTYWISPIGNDSTSCASIRGTSDPRIYRRTIAGGAACLSGGDTLKIRGGTYVEQLKNPLPSGISASQPTVMEGVAGELVIIRPPSGGGAVISFTTNRSFMTFRNLTLDGVNLRSGETTGFQIGNTRVVTGLTIENCEIKNHVSSAITLGDSVSNALVRQNKLHDGLCDPNGDYSCHGIYLRATNSIVEHNEIFNNKITGITIYSQTVGATGNIIRYNYFHGNSANTGTAGPGAGTGDRAINLSRANNIIHNNVIAYNVDHGIKVTATATNSKIYNNTIINNGGRGIWLQSTAGTGIEVKNNIVLGNSSGQIVCDACISALTNNLTAGTASDILVNPSAGDFRPKSSTLTLGAYDYGTPNATQTPLPPSNLVTIGQ